MHDAIVAASHLQQSLHIGCWRIRTPCWNHVPAKHCQRQVAREVELGRGAEVVVVVVVAAVESADAHVHRTQSLSAGMQSVLPVLLAIAVS